MIDYIPPDIPPAVVQFADEKYRKPNNATRWIRYMTIYKGNLEVYATKWNEPRPEFDPKTGERTFYLTGLPSIIIYDCHTARKPTMEEVWDIDWFMPKYLYNAKIKSEHLCHRDLKAYNQHNTPNLYKKKVKYYTPRYIPKPVLKYINKQYPVSWTPGTYDRYVKYLTTYDDKYEVYFVYWKDPNSDWHSVGKYVLYDCQNVRGYKDNKERIDLIFLKSKTYDSTAIPNFCKSKHNK